MPTKGQIKVFSGIRLLLKLTNLYNKNGVRIKYNKMGDSVKIPDYLLFCLILLPTLYYVSLLIWVVIEEKFNLKLISYSLATVICTLQVILAYISLAIKTDLVILTIDHLQEAVQKSK